MLLELSLIMNKFKSKNIPEPITEIPPITITEHGKTKVYKKAVPFDDF